MPDTDIGKPINWEGETVAEVALYHTSNGSTCDHCDEIWPCTVSGLTAELVGLRTEVDQLRTENAELRENVIHMESERTGKCLACGEDWTCNGYYADIVYDERHGLAAALRRATTAETALATIREVRSCLGAGPMDYEAFTAEVDRALAAAVPVVGAEEPTERQPDLSQLMHRCGECRSAALCDAKKDCIGPDNARCFGCGCYFTHEHDCPGETK